MGARSKGSQTVCGRKLARFSMALALLLWGVAMFHGTARAQGTTAEIEGVVSDSSRAVIPGASVTVINVETNLQRKAESGSAGAFAITNLPPGIYRIEVTMRGFQTSIRENVTLTVGQRLLLNTTLELGEVSQQVSVVAETTQLQTTTSEVSGSVSPTRVQELPLLGRDFRDLTMLLPGVIPIPASYSQGSVTTSGLRAFRISISGGRTTATGYYFDGLYINNQSGYAPAGVNGGQLGIDAVREFRVLVNSYTAEYGRSGSGAVEMVSRSGTNNLHGSVFEFFRNDKLNARNFFDVPTKAPQRRNQFGASAGGPIQKDKTFFFGSWEGLRAREGQASVGRVPDLNARAGLLPDGRGSLAAVPNLIGTPVAAAVMKLYPAPNGRNFGDGSAESNVLFMSPTRDDFVNGRLDRSLTANHNLMARYTLDEGTKILPLQVPTFQQFNKSRIQWISLGESWVASSNMINTFRAGLARTWTQLVEHPSPGTTVDPIIIIPGRFDPPGINIANLSEVGQNNASQHGIEVFNVFQYSDDVVYNRSAHTVKFGVRLDRQQRNVGQTDRMSQDGRSAQQPLWTFLTLSDFFAGRVSVLRDSLGVIGRQGGFRQTLLGGYVQDEYRPRSNLTLNLGLRIENMTPPSYTWPTYRMADVFSSDANSPADFLYKTSPVIAPRAGLSWSPLKKHISFTIRAGAGIFYDQLGRGFWANGYALNTPYSNQTTLRAVPFPNPYPGGVYPAAARFSVNWAYDTHQKVPTAYQYNLTLSELLFDRVQIRASYVGSQSRHLVDSKSVNTYPRSVVNGRVFYDKSGPTRNPNYGADIFLNTTESNAYYNSFQLSASTRLRGSSTFEASYTYSKCIDLVSADNTSDFGGLRDKYLYDAYNPRNERGRCSMDIRQRLALNLVYPLPFENLSGWRGVVARGWSVSTIVSVSGGAPFTPHINFPRSDNLQTASSGNANMERPDLAPGAVISKIVRGGPDQYFTPSAFVLQPEGFLGTAGRNILIGPGMASMDLSLVRSFPVREKLQMQFRGEFFNLLNRVNFGLPNYQVFTNTTGVANPAAGRISNTSISSRQVQLALKLVF